MRWLITGGCGFIGSALAERLTREPGNRVRIFDNLSVGSRESLAARCGSFTEIADGGEDDDGWRTELSLVVGDITNAEAFARAASGADVIVHLAANTGVAPSVDDPMADATTNVFGVLNGLEAARHHGVTRFVFASSGAPLGVQTPPLHEELAPHPASPYGASKLAGEGYCSAYYHCFGVETVALRFGNVYGPGSTHKSSVVAKFIRKALAGERLEVYGDGNQTRDFIYLADLLDAVIAAGTRTGVDGEVFQIATNAETTVNELCRRLFDVFNTVGIDTPPVDFGPTRQGDVARNYSDTSKAALRLGWTATTDLTEGLTRTVRWFNALPADGDDVAGPDLRADGPVVVLDEPATVPGTSR